MMTANAAMFDLANTTATAGAYAAALVLAAVIVTVVTTNIVKAKR